MTEWFSTALLVLAAVYAGVVLLFWLGLFFPRRGINQRQYSVSVVIAARNEERTIERLLEDLAHQTYPRDKYEVIVVDDDSTDRTAEIVQRAAQKYPHFQYVRSAPGDGTLSPKKQALASGIAQSKGEIILTTDADCRVRSTWIGTMVSYFLPRVGMVAGFSQLGRKHERRSTIEQLQAIDFLALMAAAAGSCNLGFPLAASGQNLGYRRCVYEEVGGFRAIGHRISGDDVLLLQLVRRRTRWRLRFASSPRAFNTSEPEPSLHRLFHQRVRWASNGAFQIRQNVAFFAYILCVYLFNLSLLVGGVCALFVPTLRLAVSAAFAAKVIAELLLLLRAAHCFGRGDLLLYFPLWTLAEVPYIVVVGIVGTFGKFSWKGRRANAALRRLDGQTLPSDSSPPTDKTETSSSPT
ncbi:MAG: glycosyltransferase [candidate division KSB1 bacterium]|nr:glycosyltransferase [candidate division KSB1 bacterium]MDZ7295213.1 glycosyltransferase [candidate division KSB1 bacterium]MDZ7386509.1 glycosyltransferase [candidate division KSB1 bacterium]MDZ7391300.1 glycosyltransferase [candidate division KSB1 bacterium]MDZ7413446.1 glycosyltransferase [candidate division KSB1 bacterium]